MCAKKKILKNIKVSRVSFKPRNRLNENPKAAKLINSHTDI